MSIKVTNWVWSRSESRNGARLVMLALADRADDQGLAWPSIEDLAERSRLSPRAVQKAIATLVDIGELEVDGGGGRHRSNRYRIVPKPRTSDGVTDSKPRTFDGVSGGETPNFATETPNSATRNPELCDRNPVQSSPEPFKNHQQNRQGTPTPAPEPQTPADAMLTKWWEQYGRTTAQGKSSIRRAIADALGNHLPAETLWTALCRLGDLSKPITGGTLQFALSELRAANPAAGSNVVPLAGRRPSTTDQRVNDALAIAAEFRALEEGTQQ